MGNLFARDLFHWYQDVYDERQREVLDRLAESSEQYGVTIEEAANGMSELLRRIMDSINDKRELDSPNDEEVDAFIL